MTSNITFSFVLVPVILLTKKYHVTTAAPGQAYDPKCFLQSCLVTVAEILAAKQTRHLAVIFGRGFWEHFCDEEGVYASLKG